MSEAAPKCNPQDSTGRGETAASAWFSSSEACRQGSRTPALDRAPCVAQHGEKAHSEGAPHSFLKLLCDGRHVRSAISVPDFPVHTLPRLFSLVAPLPPMPESSQQSRRELEKL